MPDLRMVIFDFDGVIADSERAHFKTFRETLQEIGVQIDWDQYCDKYLGYTDLECIRHILIDNSLSVSEQEINQICEHKSAKFASYIKDNNLIIGGVKRLLEDLRGHNILISICSGALLSEIECILGNGDMRDFFTDIVTAEDVSRGKPDPEGFRLAVERINSIISNADDSLVSPLYTSINDSVLVKIVADECVVVEDSIWGIKAAHAAGIRCLAVTNSYQAETLHEADMVVKDLSEVNTEVLSQIIK